MIHPSAMVSAHAKIGANVSIGPFTIIHENVIIEDNSEIGAYCELGISSALSDGSPLHIARGALIRSHSIFYEGSQFGEKLVTGHRVTVREMTRAGKGLQIGSQSEFQGHCSIGDFTRTQSNVFIGQKSVIGNFVWLFPYVVLTNDPHPPSNILKGCVIEDYAAIAAMSVILPGIVVGKRSLVGARTLVTRDVPAGKLVLGNPGKIIGDASEINLQDGSGLPAYPWVNHFHRGYPQDVVAAWQAEVAATATEPQRS